MKSEIYDKKRRAGLQVDYLPAYTYTACLAQLHPVVGFGPLDDPSSPRPPAELRVRLPEIGYERVTRPRSRSESGASGEAPLDAHVANRLEGLSRRTTAHLHVAFDGKDVAKLPVVVLPIREWPHLPELRKTVAAHVLPGDDVVFRAVVDTSAGAGADGRSLPEIAHGAAEGAVRDVLGALFDHLMATRDIEYEEPRAERDTWSDVTYQTVRNPHRVIGPPDPGRGKGTCLDLTLLLAGCLESLGLHPLVLFDGGPDESPSHAFLGCWTDSGKRYRPLLTDTDDLRSRVARGELLVLEATGLCAGRHRLTFAEAIQSARRHVESDGRIHAVDVSAARPPHGTVRPLRLANDPVVQGAYWAGEELRKRLRARARETLHILYGLSAGGGATWRLLETSGGSARRVCEIIERSLCREGHTAAGAETNSYRVCIETARANARDRGAATVEEVDVL